MEKEKVAIIGTGIAGMSAAYFLQHDYQLTIYEKNDYIGGHTNTIEVDEDGEKKPIDTGFMVFNERTYPLLTRLFKKLEIDYYDTDMSFAVRFDPRGLEYNGSNLMGLFSQRKNLLNFSFIKMLWQINRFNHEAPKHLAGYQLSGLTVQDYIKKYDYGEDFLYQFLIPMSSAVWSTPNSKILNFPIETLVRFFFNHGFMGLNTQYQWKTVRGGSREYRKKLIENFKDCILLNNAAVKVVVQDNKPLVIDQKGHQEEFSRVILATHGDEAYQILDGWDSPIRKLLENFSYQENIATVHTDSKVMPYLKRTWSSWNYITTQEKQNFVVYYMNKLQKVSEKQDYFININGEEFVDSSKILKQIVYHHPVFDLAAIGAQKELRELNNKSSCVNVVGSYLRYGFHEDALLSSVELCSKILDREVLAG